MGRGCAIRVNETAPPAGPEDERIKSYYILQTITLKKCFLGLVIREALGNFII